MSNVPIANDNSKSKFSELIDFAAQVSCAEISVDAEYKRRKRRAYEIDRYIHVKNRIHYGRLLANEIMALDQKPKHIRVGIKTLQQELKMIARLMKTLRRDLSC